MVNVSAIKKDCFKCPYCKERAFAVWELLVPTRQIRINYGFYHKCGGKIKINLTNWVLYGMLSWVLGTFSIVVISYVFQKVVFIIYVFSPFALYFVWNLVDAIFTKFGISLLAGMEEK